MNLAELYQIVHDMYQRAAERGHKKPEDILVGIHVQRAGAVGGTPVVGIRNIYDGIDWDANKIIIEADALLREIERDEIKAIRDHYDELGWTVMQRKALVRENNKLKEEIKKLKEQ